MKIEWKYPQPRGGLAGSWDRFIGPGATTAEFWVELVFASVAAIAVPLYASVKGLDWTIWQLLVAGLFAFDLAGGIVTNATSTAKRWYHRDGQGHWQHFGFVAVHVIHIWVVAWLFRGMDWAYFFGMSLYLLAGTGFILALPLYLQRPVALGVFAFAIPFSLYVFPPMAGMEWFIPFLFLKLMVSHALREEPYRPEAETV